MNDLREALDRESRRVRADLGALDQVMRRADKHHRNRRITAGAVALVVVVAGFTGVVGALRNTGGSRSADGGWRALWPQQSRADAEIAQERANQGDRRLTWQQDAEDFLWQFGNDGLRWVATTIPQVPYAAERGATTVTVLGYPFGQCEGDGDSWRCPMEPATRARVTIERLLQPGPGGIWFVTEVEVDGTRPQLENSPLPPVDTPQPGDASPQPGGPSATQTAPAAGELPDQAADFVGAFMDSRLAGTDFARDRLSIEAATAYHGDEGLALYGYTREPGATWEIYGWNVLPNTDRWRVVVRISGTGGDFPESGTIHETLLVGSPGDGRPYQVLSAERNE